MAVKGKWAQGIEPRNFRWVIKGSLAVCERPGGYGPNHRRVRRQEEIIWVREQGFATSWGEHRADLSAVAVPIFGVGAHPEAALTVAGPLTELTPQRTPQILENMRSAARHIESELGTGIRAS